VLTVYNSLFYISRLFWSHWVVEGCIRLRFCPGLNRTPVRFDKSWKADYGSGFEGQKPVRFPVLAFLIKRWKSTKLGENWIDSNWNNEKHRNNHRVLTITWRNNTFPEIFPFFTKGSGGSLQLPVPFQSGLSKFLETVWRSGFGSVRQTAVWLRCSNFGPCSPLLSSRQFGQFWEFWRKWNTSNLVLKQ